MTCKIKQNTKNYHVHSKQSSLRRDVYILYNWNNILKIAYQAINRIGAVDLISIVSHFYVQTKWSVVWNGIYNSFSHLRIFKVIFIQFPYFSRATLWPSTDCFCETNTSCAKKILQMWEYSCELFKWNWYKQQKQQLKKQQQKKTTLTCVPHMNSSKIIFYKSWTAWYPNHKSFVSRSEEVHCEMGEKIINSHSTRQ